MTPFGKVIVALVLALTTSSTLHAQELAPRTYVSAPAGLNFLAVGYAFASGRVFMDPALPIEGLEADLHISFLRYTRTFALAGRGAKFKLFVPFSSGDWEGVVVDEEFAILFGRTTGFQTRSATGFGDARLTLEWNFKSPLPTSRPPDPEMAKKTVAGLSVQLVTPTGEYDKDRLINLGANRWSVRTELGASKPVGKWDLEGAVGAWLFGDNTEFAREFTLSQEPLYVAKGHIIYNWRPGVWLASGFGYAEGGRTKVDGAPRNTDQRNWRFGLVFAYPLRPNQGFSVGVVKAITDKAGPDFDTVSVAYQFGWGGAR